ncbi:hypothetical protein PaecuDRAFT_1003 [Paenibacillus curdlanolyticus YK9]|uniref:Uncharacterized protein n=2 Tax=Paenibacillus curdlanolyticus TaxID=59840 RepID=E0I5T1_9BACL|nr:hypothetical protein PaecuDRAFT_1003 [Paenibacillus curdlanolyticus YK9]
MFTACVACVILFMQWMSFFRSKKGSAGEKAVSISLIFIALALNIALRIDLLTTSPLIILRVMFEPAAKALVQWGMGGG